MSQTQESNAPTLFQFQQDLNEQEAPQPLPVGTYRGQIKAVNATPSKKDPGIYNAVVEFFISADQYPVDYTEGDPDGTKLRYYVSLANTPIARFGLKNFLLSIQAPIGREVDLTTWLGLDAMLKIEHEAYEGRMMAKIARNGVTPS